MAKLPEKVLDMEEQTPVEVILRKWCFLNNLVDRPALEWIGGVRHRPQFRCLIESPSPQSAHI